MVATQTENDFLEIIYFHSGINTFIFIETVTITAQEKL